MDEYGGDCKRGDWRNSSKILEEHSFSVDFDSELRFSGSPLEMSVSPYSRSRFFFSSCCCCVTKDELGWVSLMLPLLLLLVPLLLLVVAEC